MKLIQRLFKCFISKKLNVGQKVLTGQSENWEREGEIRSIFKTKAGNIKYVVEQNPELLYICSDTNVKAI